MQRFFLDEKMNIFEVIESNLKLLEDKIYMNKNQVKILQDLINNDEIKLKKIKDYLDAIK